MLNTLQIELGNMLFNKVKQKFPELMFVSITESPENPKHLWVNVVMPENEVRRREIREFASDIETDILLEYGYKISLRRSAWDAEN